MQPPPRIEPDIAPVNGIVQPPVMPPANRPGRNTNVLEELETILKNIWKKNCSYYFRLPVDAVTLNIPDYHELIKHPMDLTTIKKRLQNNYYWQADEMLHDLELIFENCLLYNPKDSAVSQACNELKNAFYTRLAYIDMNNEQEIVPETTRIMKRKAPLANTATANSKTVKTTAAARRSTRKARKPKKPVKAAVPRKLAKKDPEEEPEEVPGEEVEDIKYEIPEEVQLDAKIKEEPPELKPVPTLEYFKFEIKPDVLTSWQDYLIEKTHCKYMLKFMTKRKRIRVAWPFRNCDLWHDYAQNPNYSHSEEQKLDWKILSRKVEKNHFDNFDDFIATVRVMFQNALTCFPLDKSLIASVNEANEVLESRIEKCRKSMTDMKKRIRDATDEKVNDFNKILSQIMK